MTAGLFKRYFSQTTATLTYVEIKEISFDFFSLTVLEQNDYKKCTFYPN